MYITVREYIQKQRDIPRPFVVDALAELRETDTPFDVLDYVLTPDLEYIIDVLSLAKSLVAHLANVFDDTNAERIARHATAAALDVRTVSAARGYDPTDEIISTARYKLQELSATLLQERFAEYMINHEWASSTILEAFETVFDARISPTHALYRKALLHLTIRERQPLEDVLAAFRKWKLTPDGQALYTQLHPVAED